MSRLSVVIITLNEESNIQDCLASVHWADEIIVVDGGSSDRTLELAREATSHVYQIPFTNFAEQKNRAIEKATGDWILILDADERVSEGLAVEIRKEIAGGESAVYELPRDTYFFGKLLRYGGVQDDAPRRLFPAGQAAYTQPVHERLITSLPVKRLKHRLTHLSTRNREQYTQKMNCYIPLEVQFMIQEKRRSTPLHPWVLPGVKFLQLWIVRKGILDGTTGLKYAILSAYYLHRKHKLYRQKQPATG